MWGRVNTEGGIDAGLVCVVGESVAEDMFLCLKVWRSVSDRKSRDKIKPS